jgi:hypothetical protein
MLARRGEPDAHCGARTFLFAAMPVYLPCAENSAPLRVLQRGADRNVRAPVALIP